MPQGGHMGKDKNKRAAERQTVRRAKSGVSGAAQQRVIVTFKTSKSFGQLEQISSSWSMNSTEGSGPNMRYKSISCAPRIAKLFQKAFETE